MSKTNNSYFGNHNNAFSQEFDNGQGFVNVKELRDVLTTLGEKMTDQEFEEMMSEATITKDGLIQIEGNILS